MDDIGQVSELLYTVVIINKDLFTPGEVPYLRGSYDKIQKEIGWTPKIKWQETLEEMIDFDQNNLKAGSQSDKN